MRIDAFSISVLRCTGLPPLRYVLGMAMFDAFIHHYGPTTEGAAEGRPIMVDGEAPNIAMPNTYFNGGNPLNES